MSLPSVISLIIIVINLSIINIPHFSMSANIERCTHEVIYNDGGNNKMSGKNTRIRLDLQPLVVHELHTGASYLNSTYSGSFMEKYRYRWNPCSTFSCGAFVGDDIAVCRELKKIGYAPFYHVVGLHSTAKLEYDESTGELLLKYQGLPLPEPVESLTTTTTLVAPNLTQTEIRLTCVRDSYSPHPDTNQTQFLVDDSVTQSLHSSNIFRMRLISPFACPQTVNHTWPWYIWTVIAVGVTILFLCVVASLWWCFRRHTHTTVEATEQPLTSCQCAPCHWLVDCCARVRQGVTHSGYEAI